MEVTVGYSDHPDSSTAGRQVARTALAKTKRREVCDMALLFCTARHNQQQLRDAVVAETGNERCIYGGGAAGIITNDKFGYAGYQVGLALFWFEDSDCTVLVEEGLQKDETEAGARLGRRLSTLGTTPASPVMLFYDAVDWTSGSMRLMMATWLLDGLRQGLGFLPDLAGAGLQGDHMCTPTKQYVGEGMTEHSIITLAFSEDIRIDSTIMHGCHPASPYYTVTKADGPVILEIDNEPALAFMDKLLGPAVSVDDYPFFLIFGINHGERWGDYDEDNYASRLCFGIDKARGGIVMFEPDMVEGTEFQLMYRSLELDYMQPKIERAFEQVNGRDILFTMYIDCAGRCAGYGGLDIEDALVVQSAVGDRAPLLGLYTGVEIAPIGGRPRGLDWTGVFCIFSKKPPGEDDSEKAIGGQAWEKDSGNSQNQGIPLEAAVKICEQNAAKVLALDEQSIAVRHELEQKRRGFRLLAELSVSLRSGVPDESLFDPVAQRINSALNMQKTIVLSPDGEGLFIPRILQGYTASAAARLAGTHIPIELEFLDPEKPVLVTGADDPERLAPLRKTLDLPYFISCPIIVDNKIAAILITGRMMETAPFLSRLGSGDVETVQAVSALLASVLVFERLSDATKRAQTDALTGLLNRGALELLVTDRLKNGLPAGQQFAFIVIDFDYFKQVNDRYGHMEGDAALRALAQALKKNFRSLDFVARVGGDEFVVVCAIQNEVEQITSRVAQLVERWARIALVTEKKEKFNATLSIGISVAPRDGTTYNALFKKADVALYYAKQHGRNQYALYDPSMQG